jgi:hypothetical protein
VRRNDKLSNVAVLVANYPRPKAISSCVERVETRRDLLLAFGIGNPRAFAQVENGAVVLAYLVNRPR